jgi:hypothetical protein
MMIDLSKPKVLERHVPQTSDRVIGGDFTALHRVKEFFEIRRIHEHSIISHKS